MMGNCLLAAAVLKLHEERAPRACRTPLPHPNDDKKMDDNRKLCEEMIMLGHMGKTLMVIQRLPS
jgi:hypothetical protein